MTDLRCDHCQQTDLYCTCPEGLYRQEAFALVERELRRVGITHIVFGIGVSAGDHDTAALMCRTLLGAVDAFEARGKR